jgi:hypothetical protein
MDWVEVNCIRQAKEGQIVYYSAEQISRDFRLVVCDVVLTGR